MRLTDIMSGLNLSIYPQIALVIFVAIFTGVLIRVFSRSRQSEFERAANLPLNEDGDIAPELDSPLGATLQEKGSAQ